MASERDEFIYHECMVHVPALTHGDPQVGVHHGGGDGCSARELLRYAGMERIVVAELDPVVVASCRQQFAHVNGGALDHRASNVRIGDALATLRESDARYDLIVMDLTDPGDDEDSPANALYSPDTYALIRSRLTANGLDVAHRQCVLPPGAVPPDVRSCAAFSAKLRPAKRSCPSTVANGDGLRVDDRQSCATCARGNRGKACRSPSVRFAFLHAARPCQPVRLACVCRGLGV